MSAFHFFSQLEAFSARYLERIHCPTVSPWRGQRPQVYEHHGAVIHWTADIELDKVSKWFTRKNYHAGVSAHFVVARERIPEQDAWGADFPMVRDLPLTVIQYVPIDQTAWHARWANGWSVGIEVLNAGELRSGDRAPRRISRQCLNRCEDVYPYQNRRYQSYTSAQVNTVADLLGWVHEAQTLVPWLLVGHSNVQKNKRDPGPGFPLYALRDRLFGYGLPRATPYTHMEASLAALGYDLGNVTESTKLFQTMMGLTPDGIIGPETRATILSRMLELYY